MSEASVYFNGKYIGFRHGPDRQIGLQRCGACRLENYALAVLDGVCCWCGWDANAEVTKEPEVTP
jgi:hypothetical protein